MPTPNKVFVQRGFNFIREHPGTTASEYLRKLTTSFPREERFATIEKINWAIENPKEYVAELLGINLQELYEHEAFHQEILGDSYW